MAAAAKCISFILWLYYVFRSLGRSSSALTAQNILTIIIVVLMKWGKELQFQKSRRRNKQNIRVLILQAKWKWNKVIINVNRIHNAIVVFEFFSFWLSCQGSSCVNYFIAAVWLALYNGYIHALNSGVKKSFNPFLTQKLQVLAIFRRFYPQNPFQPKKSGLYMISRDFQEHRQHFFSTVYYAQLAFRAKKNAKNAKKPIFAK